MLTIACFFLISYSQVASNDVLVDEQAKIYLLSFNYTPPMIFPSWSDIMALVHIVLFEFKPSTESNVIKDVGQSSSYSAG